jgi:hypothetical protein
MDTKHAKVFLHPRIWITAEHAAGVLGISIEKADQILSRPDTYELLKSSLHSALQTALLSTLQQMARIPHESVPTRIDCVADCPSVQFTPIMGN